MSVERELAKFLTGISMRDLPSQAVEHAAKLIPRRVRASTAPSRHVSPPAKPGKRRRCVKDGIMYVVTGNDDVFALDANTGEMRWERLSGIDQKISTVCD